MKYKVGDKTLFGKITDTDKKASRYPYRVECRLQTLWLTESEIDKIIIKPKRNIDHIIELWESGKKDEAADLYEKCVDLSAGYERGDDVCVLIAPYAEPSKYHKLTPDELKALELAKECGFKWVCRICDFISIGETEDGAYVEDGIRSSWIPALKILDDTDWIPEKPMSIDSLLKGE